MAISDLLERITGADDDDSDQEPVTVPDDLAELEEDGGQDDALPPDPKPARRGGRIRLTSRPGKASAKQRAQVRDGLQLLLVMLGGGIALRDRVCGPALQQVAADTAKAAAPIICRNPALLHWFTAGDAPFLDLLALASALGPFVSAVWAHHGPHGGREAPVPEGGVPVDLSAYSAP